MRVLILEPLLTRFTAAVTHEFFILGNSKSFSIDNAGPLWPRAITVVGVVLHVLSAQPRLLFVVGLLLLRRHGLPTSPENFRNVAVVHIGAGLVGKNDRV